MSLLNCATASRGLARVNPVLREMSVIGSEFEKNSDGNLGQLEMWMFIIETFVNDSSRNGLFEY